MKKILLALLCLPAVGWATYIPVNGSTIVVQAANNNTTAIPTSQQGNITINAVPTGANNIGTVSGSSVTMVQGGASITQTGGALDINIKSGSIANTGFNVNNTPAVSQSGTWNVGTVTTLTGITNALPAGTNVIGGVTTTQTSSETVLGIGENAYANNGSAWTQGQPSQHAILTKSGMLSTWSGPDITFPSYTASTGTLASAASATDIAELCGNASNTVLVYDIRASCTETTAGNVLVKVIKRSTADTGVIASSFTSSGVSDDSSYAVAISTFALYTANPTVGTTAVLEDAYQLGCMASATATPNDVYISPASWRMKPIVLRGAAQCLAFNLNGATVTGGAWTITYKWLELQTP